MPRFAKPLEAARALFSALRPAPLAIDAAERWRVIAGCGLGVLLAALLSRWAAGGGAMPWQFAPLGASALLVFGVPGSPMAQPWAVVAGNTVSALVGIACVHLVPDAAFGGALALSAAVAAMLALRCLHPPGGATALLMVLTHTASPGFAFFPVFCDSLVLVTAGVLYNRLTGRAYPHAQRAAPAGPTRASRFTAADLDAALARRNQVLDIGRDELEALLEDAEAQAYRRNIGELRCRDVMSREPHVVHFGTPLLEAWALMRRHRIKALPVVDRARRVVGIVTTADFIRLANLDQPLGLAARLRAVLRPSGRTHGERPEVIGQIMTRNVRVASEEGSVAELIPLFSSSGHHHLPIIDGEQRIVGIVTQSDLVRALHRAVRPEA